MPLGAGSFRRRLMWEEGGAGPGLGFQDTQGGFLAALLSGAVGLFTDPIRGAEEGGLLGLVRGLQRGALGAVALPLASLLEMSARFADSVRRAVAGSSNVGWLRPPRHVSASEPLTPYDWSQAMGRWLLQGLDRAEAQRAQRRRLPPSASDFVPGEFVLCAPAGARGCYLVLTSRRVLHVRAKGLMWEPVVLWQAEVADLEMVGPGSTAAAVRFVSNPAPKRLELGRRRGGEAKAAHGAALFAFLGVECADSEAATRVRETAHRLMEAVPKRTEPVGLSLVVAPVV